MPEKSRELANLARVGKLATEPGTPGEIKGLLTSGSERLVDARNESLALSSRFDLCLSLQGRAQNKKLENEPNPKNEHHTIN